MNKKRMLKILLLQIVMSATIFQVVFAEKIESSGEPVITEEIVVEAERLPEENRFAGDYVQPKGKIGFLGEKDIMEIPFLQTNLTEKTIETLGADPAQALTSIMVNVPSVRTSSSTLYHDFSIRGQKADGYQLRINGIPGLFSQTNMPMNFVESAEVTSGPGVGTSGVSAKESPGGTINLVTKRAGEKDFTRYTTAFSGRSSWGNYLDYSKRFGRDRSNGIRINAAYVGGDSAIPNEKVEQKNIFINIDRKTDKYTTNLFAGYRDTRTEGAQRYFDFSNASITRLPGAPNNKNNYSFEGQELGMRTSLITFNHTHKVADKTKVFFNTGYAYNDGYDYVVPASSRLDVINDNGDFKRNINNEPFAIRNGYLQLGVQQDWEIGKVKNTTVFAWDKDWYSARWGGSGTPTGVMTGNIHSGNVSITHITPNLKGPQRGSRVQYYGWSAVNTAEFGKANVMLGIHRHTSSEVSAAGVKTKSSANSPLFGLVYRPNDHWTLFANHTESFHQGKTIGSGYANKGDILPAAKTKSNEVGVKYSNSSFLTSLSLFQMKQEAEFLDSSANVLSLNGESKYKGLELAVAGKVAPSLNIMGGLMYLDSEYRNNNNPYFNGKTIKGTADWSAVLTLEYEATQKMSLWGRMTYTGKAPIYTNANRKLDVPSFVVFDVGVRYKTQINKTLVTFNATVFNVFNKDYWMARPSYNFAILGSPRTFALSAQFEF